MATGLIGGLLNVPELVFKIKKSGNGQFYWTAHRTSGNTEAIAQSETYKQKSSCIHCIEQLQQFAGRSFVSDESA